MKNQIEKSFIMAERLKRLREENRYSHEKLSNALINQYGIKISPDSLMNYEVSVSHHTKAGKNQGMRVEYLRCLADFYNVSTDYLLGLSNVKTPSTDLQAVVAYTGLSEDNVATLNTHKVAAAFDPPLTYNNARSVQGDELFLDCANDLLDALYKHSDRLLSNYYLLRSLAANITQCDPEYCNEKRVQDLASHGYAPVPVRNAVQFLCLEFSSVIEWYLRSKYADADRNNDAASASEGE